MPFSVKDWKDYPDTSTPITQAALEDMETRLSAYTTNRTAVSVLEYGAVGNNSTGCDTAIANAIAAVDAAGGGTVFFPTGTYRIYSPLDVSGLRNIRLVGEATENDVLGEGTTLIYAGSGADSAINAQNTVGFEMDGINIGYANSGFTGYLVDFSNSLGSGYDTRKGGLSRCCLSGITGGWTYAAALVCLANAVDMTFTKVRFQGGDIGVLGREIAADWSISHRFIACDFGNNGTAHVKNAGSRWTFYTPVVEGLVGDKAGFYTHDSGVLAGGLTVIDGYWGDILATGGLGSHFKWAGTGLVLLGGTMGMETAGVKGIVIDANDCNGIFIALGAVAGPGSPLLEFGSTSGHKNVFVMPGELVDGAAAYAGTKPTNAVLFNSDGQLTFGGLPNLYQVSAGTNRIATDGGFSVAGTTYTLNLEASGIVVGIQGIRTQDIGSDTPTGGTTGDIFIGNSKIWVNFAGTWKSVTLS